MRRTPCWSPAADGVLSMHPASTAVNSPKNQSERLIQAVEAEGGLFDAA